MGPATPTPVGVCGGCGEHGHRHRRCSESITGAGLPGSCRALGALGVVADLTLAIEPTFEVRQDVYEHLPWDQLTGSFDDVMGAGYSVSAITDFAGADVDMLWVKSRMDGGASRCRRNCSVHAQPQRSST